MKIIEKICAYKSKTGVYLRSQNGTTVRATFTEKIR